MLVGGKEGGGGGVSCKKELRTPRKIKGEKNCPPN